MKQIAWIISPPAKGSGGFRTICSKASFLDSRGYENYFYIIRAVKHTKVLIEFRPK